MKTEMEQLQFDSRINQIFVFVFCIILAVSIWLGAGPAVIGLSSFMFGFNLSEVYLRAELKEKLNIIAYGEVSISQYQMAVESMNKKEGVDGQT